MERTPLSPYWKPSLSHFTFHTIKTLQQANQPTLNQEKALEGQRPSPWLWKLRYELYSTTSHRHPFLPVSNVNINILHFCTGCWTAEYFWTFCETRSASAEIGQKGTLISADKEEPRSAPRSALPTFSVQFRNRRPRPQHRQTTKTIT